MNDAELFDLCLKKWGIVSQIYMLAEESAELSLAAMHLNRNLKEKAKSFLALAEEIADTEIMIAEIRHFFPYLEKEIAAAKYDKRRRLEKLLCGSES
jgi:hypothetical protein